MARKLRLEYAGAVYHVINRGNYRGDVFGSAKTKAAFESCLFEACEKSKWLLHAFVTMTNHYHLILETPEGNLVAGMHWLQGTFANRFNRFRKEHGHLFQGRYKALVLGGSKPLGEVCDYVHLNPVRAGIVPVERLVDYRHSSYWYLRNPAKRPAFLRPQTALECAEAIPDNRDGWAKYDTRLELQVAELGRIGDVGRSRNGKRLCGGWAIGSDQFKAELVQKHGLVGNVRAWDSPGVKEVREIRWTAALDRAFQALGLRPQDVIEAGKKAPWKLAIATWMKAHTQAENRWLATKLKLGVPTAVSHNLTNYRRNLQATDPSWSRLKAINST